MAYFYSTKHHIMLCFVHSEICCAIAGDQVMGMRQYTTVVDGCLWLVYQPAGLSSCSGRLIGTDIVFFNMVLPKVRLSQLLPGALKSPLKSQTFVQIQGTFHFLLKSHAAMQHHKYIDHPCQWRLCQKRRGLREVQWREVQWTAVPLTPDLLWGHQAHLSLWFSPKTA